jgi:hypothetical protein
MRVTETSTINFCDFDDVIMTSKKACSDFLHNQSLSLNNYLKDLGSKFVIAYLVTEIWAIKDVSFLLQKRLSHSMYLSIYLSVYHGNLFENGGARKHPSRYRWYLKFCRLFILTWTNCCTKFQVSNSILTCIFRCLNIGILGNFT